MSALPTKDLAIVLKTHPSRESDLVVHLLCATRGKVCAIARGARRSKRRFLSGLDVFDRGVAELRDTRVSLSALEAMSPEGGFRHLRDGLGALSAGAVLVEAFDAMTVEDDTSDSKQFFASLDRSLEMLDTASKRRELEALQSALYAGLRELLEVSGLRRTDLRADGVSPKALATLIHEVEGHIGRGLRSAEGVVQLLFSQGQVTKASP